MDDRNKAAILRWRRNTYLSFAVGNFRDMMTVGDLTWDEYHALLKLCRTILGAK